MKVLISAYACEPNEGSEAEVGLQIALAAAEQHEVWVLTRQNNIPSLSSFLAVHWPEARIHLVGLDLSERAMRWKRRGGLLGLHWYYDAWQRRVGRVASALDAQHNFDLVHHATFAAYWTRAGVATVAKPLVWGPVGGGATAPVELLPSLGIRGCLEAVTRIVARPVVAWLSGSRGRGAGAAVVLSQNTETSHRLRVDDSRVVILPNSLAALSTEYPIFVGDPDCHKLLAVGRLVPWKGFHLAIRALRHVPEDVELDVYGSGPDQARLLRLAIRLGLRDRVRFHGHMTREELFSAMATAGVLVHPALHDESPLTMTEALSRGVPVVALDRAGPPVIGALFPEVEVRLVAPSTSRRTSKALGNEITALLGLRERTTGGRATLSFHEEILSAYESAAGAGA